MATQDDDFLTAPVPEPDDEASAAERAHARTFAALVDKTLTGRPPAMMSADDRALLEVATVIRAANGGMELAASTQASVVEAALRQAIGGVSSATGAHRVTSIARSRSRRWVPWAIAGASTLVAAAAVLVLWLRVPPPTLVEVGVAQPPTPATWTSRPADPLFGPIARDQSGDASARIDYLFADRLDGFRERRLTKRGGSR